MVSEQSKNPRSPNPHWFHGITRCSRSNVIELIILIIVHHISSVHHEFRKIRIEIDLDLGLGFT
jgi:hypothetical protein